MLKKKITIAKGRKYRKDPSGQLAGLFFYT